MKKITAVLAAALMALSLASCGETAQTETETTETTAITKEETGVHSLELKKENFKQLGRTYYADGKIYCALSGTGVEFTFEGTKCSVTIEGDTNAGSPASADNYARAAIYVNGERRADELIDAPSKTLEIAADGSETTVRIIKLSESEQSVYAITDITIDGKNEKPTENKEHLIEFIGDSITCGYGVDDEDKEHHFATRTEDCTKAYAYKTAEKLGTDYSLVSFSGHGIISGYSGDGNKVPSQIVPPYYTHLGFSWGRFNGFDPLAADWDFSAAREPDVIVINLGTNDDSYCKNKDDRCEEYRTEYINFVKLIREKNPNAKIIGTLGIMGQNLYPYVELALTDYTKETGDTNVDFMMFDQQNMNEDGIAADWHPSEKTHEKAAEKLAAKIKESMNWK